MKVTTLTNSAVGQHRTRLAGQCIECAIDTEIAHMYNTPIGLRADGHTDLPDFARVDIVKGPRKVSPKLLELQEKFRRIHYITENISEESPK